MCAFHKGFWDQYIYAILPQLADTLNAFAIDEDKTWIIFEQLSNITDIFVAKHSDLEAQRRKINTSSLNKAQPVNGELNRSCFDA